LTDYYSSVIPQTITGRVRLQARKPARFNRRGFFSPLKRSTFHRI
jgi:hypothetical protein